MLISNKLCPLYTAAKGSTKQASFVLNLSGNTFIFPFLTAMAGILTYSANPPSKLNPIITLFSHKF